MISSWFKPIKRICLSFTILPWSHFRLFGSGAKKGGNSKAIGFVYSSGRLMESILASREPDTGASILEEEVDKLRSEKVCDVCISDLL